jgi:2-phosphoglycerate kinase
MDVKDNVNRALSVSEYADVMMKELKENSDKYILWRDIKQVANDLIECIEVDQYNRGQK